MTTHGRVVSTKMDEVVFGTLAAEAVAALAGRAGASRVFVMASGTLHRDTDEIGRIRAALGPRCDAVFDRVPAHTPRGAVAEASRQARDAGADLRCARPGAPATPAA